MAIKRPNGIELAEILLLLGLILLGAALWQWFGWAAVAAYVGAICIVVGLGFGYLDGQKQAKKGVSRETDVHHG